MDEKLSQVILDFERVTGKTADEVATTVPEPSSLLNQPRFNFKALSSPKLYYVYLPVLIFFLLLAFRPGFLYVRKDGQKDVFSITKLVSYTVILSLLIVIAYYVFQ